MAGSALLRQLQDRLAPVTLASEQVLAVPEPLAPLFAAGGLPRGGSVAFQGSGSWSIALALAASALGADGWLAVLGVEELGLVAAAELGVRLDRTLLVSSVASAQLGLVAATLMESVDLLMLAPRAPVGLRDARRLTARARERGTGLFLLDGATHWPEPLDLTVTTAVGGWEGLGQGHGHLRRRRLEVAAVGRRAASLRRQVSVIVGAPEEGGGPSVAAAAPPVVLSAVDPSVDPAGLRLVGPVAPVGPVVPVAAAGAG